MLESTGDECQCVRELAKLVSSLRGCRGYAKLKVQGQFSFTVVVPSQQKWFSQRGDPESCCRETANTGKQCDPTSVDCMCK